MENLDNQQQNVESIDFKSVLYRYLGYWHIFAASLIIALSIAHAFNKLSTPVYKVKAQVLIAAEDNELNPFEDMRSFKPRKGIQNEIGKLTSRNLVEKTLLEYKEDYQINYYKKTRVQTLEIYGYNPFDVIIDSSHAQGIKQKISVTILSRDKYLLEVPEFKGRVTDFKTGEIKSGAPSKEVKMELLFGQEYTDENFSFKVFLNENFKDFHVNTLYFFEIENFQQIIDQYRSKLATVETNASSIIDVEFVYTDKQKAIDFINRHVQNFVDNNLTEKNYMSDRAIDFIDNQLASLTDSMTYIENRLQNFKTSRNFIDISNESSSTFTNYYELKNQRREEKIKQSFYSYLLEYFEKNVDSEILAPSGLDIGDNLLIERISELNALYSEKSRLEATNTAESPPVRAIVVKIKRTKDLLKENLVNIAKLSDIKIRELDASIAQVQAKIDQLPATERQLFNIERKFNINDEIYTFLMQRRAESAISKASNAPDHKILEHAVYASKVYPTTTLNYLIAFILALVIPIFFIFFRDFLNDKIYTKKDIVSLTNTPILGMISHSRKLTNTAVLERPKSVISETFRTVRANVQFINPNKHVQVIAVTSTISGEGKTFCSINLASVFSLSGKKTLILGSDLRKPKIFNDFNVVNDIGLSTYLIGKASLDDVVQQTEFDNLDLITSGPIPPNPAELLESATMKELITELRTRYETIIIDTPPIGLVSDAVFCLQLADAGIFVLRQGYTPKGALNTLNDVTKSTGIKNISLLVNDVDLEQRSYGRYYGGGYGYGYSYGYGYGYGYGQYYTTDDNKEKGNWFSRLFR